MSRKRKPPGNVVSLAGHRETRAAQATEDKLAACTAHLAECVEAAASEKPHAFALVFVTADGELGMSMFARGADVHALGTALRKAELFMIAPEAFDGD